MVERKALPKTAAINVAEYEAYFRQWVEDGFEVVHLNLGSGLSSAYQNCVQAASAGACIPGGFRKSLHRDRSAGSAGG